MNAWEMLRFLSKYSSFWDDSLGGSPTDNVTFQIQSDCRLGKGDKREH